MWLFTVNRNLTALGGYMIGLICPHCQNSRLFSIKVQQYYAWIDSVYVSHTRQNSLMTAGFKKVLHWHAKGAVTLKTSFRNKYSFQASNWLKTLYKSSSGAWFEKGRYLRVIIYLPEKSNQQNHNSKHEIWAFFNLSTFCLLSTFV